MPRRQSPASCRIWRYHLRMEEPDETDFQQGEVPDALAGERLDKVAAILFQDFSRAELTRWIGAGDLTLNGETVKPKT